ncbi:MAG: acetate--CoA ligase family protein [Candidatus Bathyarchaeales archaeon]
MSSVKYLFEPRRVALIGSSELREKVGMTSPHLFTNVIYNMRKHFKGKIVIADINKKTLKDRVGETKPELAVIMLPPSLSLQQAKKCVDYGVKALVMITGGFKNHQRQQLVQLRNEHDIRILGPNTIMGVVNTANGLNTTFERGLMPPKGNIAVISQSGGVGACLLDWACFYGVGISKFAFMGDKIDVNDVDLLEYFNQDPKTKVVCLYMEGVENGRKFIETAQTVVKKKPILAVKGGITKEAAQRALSHTASMAGKDEVFDAALRKAGIIRAEDLEELLNAAIALSKQPPLKGDKIAIVSNVGGPAILAADAVAKNGLKLAQLSESTKKEIETRYPGVDASNPVDMIADAKAERFATVLRLVLADSSVDGVMVINMLKSTFFEPKDALVVAKTVKKFSGKPVVDVPAGGEDYNRIRKTLGKSNLPLYNLPEKAARALKALRLYAKITDK